MKLKSLLVITLFVVACGLASAQTFGFESAGGSLLYCDYEQLINNGNDLWTGSDNLSACGIPFNAAISGFTASLPAGAGLPVAGSGVDYGDSQIIAIDAYETGYLYNDMWTVHSALKCNKFKKGVFTGKYSWFGVAGSSFGGLLGTNYGYLTGSSVACGSVALPARLTHTTNGVNSGKAVKAAANRSTKLKLN